MKIWIRKWVFRLLLALPSLLLLTLVGAFFVRAWQVRSVDADQLLRRVEHELSEKRGEKSKLTKEDGKSGIRTPWGGFTPLEGKAGEPVVYAFGGSSLVYPGDWNFPSYLEKVARQEGAPIHMVNLGYEGYSSISVRDAVEIAITHRPPDLVLIYTGHNDYTTLYWNHLFKNDLYLVKGSPVLRLFSRLAYAIGSSLRNRQGDVVPFTYGVYVSTVLEPLAFKVAERTLGLLSHFSGLFARANKLVLKHYQENMDGILSLCRERKVPVLLVTPVSNLHVPPIGLGGEAAALHARGLAADTYEERILLLSRARDADLFSGMIRAKSSLLETLRARHAPPWVHVLDLDRALQKEKNPLDHTQFSDALHISDALHRTIARLLFGVITAQNLL